MMEGKKILIGITGSIAAYKIPLMVRRIKKMGAQVKIIMTPDARDFVTPLTLSVLSENPVLTKAFNEETGEWVSHVELGLWADLMLIAPASANTIARMANGIADNLLLTTYLSAKCSVLFAPAMDLDMFRHPVTKENIGKLEKKGDILIEAREGELASGLCGEGRMEEPEKIVEILSDHLKKKELLKGKKVMVSAGPTYEAIDPVRFIGNHSSGLMGYEIARSAAQLGAEVYLISGPTHLSIQHPKVYPVKVTSAEEMYHACLEVFPDCDAAVMAAAVADYTPEQIADKKIKKASGMQQIKLRKTRDILKELGKRKTNAQKLIGFALETDKELENARQKLENKNLDLIVLNSLKDKGAGFGTDTNKISILSKKGNVKEFSLKSKKQVAADIVDELVALMKS